MILLLLSGTLFMGCALVLCALLPRQASEARRRLLLGAMAAALVLPFAPWFMPSITWSVAPSHHLMMWTRSEAMPGAAACLFGVWLLGATLLGIRLLRASFQLWVLRAHSQLMSHRERRALQRAVPALPGRLVSRIHLSPDLLSPCVIPFGRGRILLPVSHQSWDHATLACVVCHELEHLRRGDVWWGLLAEMFRIVWWFHPWAHRLVRDWSLQCEHLCDAAALRAGASPQAYARALLSLASGAPAMTGALSFANSHPSRLRHRVERVLQPSPSGATECEYLGWIALVMLLIMGLAAFAVRSVRQGEIFRQSSLQTDARLRLEANPFPAGG